MENIGPLFVLVANCCLVPLLSFAAGVWFANGMPGSPWVVHRRGNNELPVDPYED